MIVNPYTLLRRGAGHKLSCEDALFFEQRNNIAVAGVFDGCSSAPHGLFAASLFSMALGAAFNQVSAATSGYSLHALLWAFFSCIKSCASAIGLPFSELLSTAIFAWLDTDSDDCRIVALGDGVVCIGGQTHIIDQQNCPDYPAYHLTELKSPDQLDFWLEQHGRRWDVFGPKDLTISTDGILSLKPIGLQHPTAFDALTYLTADRSLSGTKAMLSRKVNLLKTNHNLEHDDDLGMIRLIMSTDFRLYD